MSEKIPFVTSIIVTRNEEKFIYRSLMSMINQNYPKDRYEIIVVDGMSDDKTREIIQEIQDKIEYGPNIRLFYNPKRLLASGWNIGIKEAKGKFVTRIDAHAEANSDFLIKGVETAKKMSDVVCVGGKLVTKSIDDNMVSKILSSPFGVGNSSFRVSDKAGYADTAVYGLYKKDIFEKVGYFNEAFKRNQDIELHSRIKSYGGKFYFNPEIVCIYYSRSKVSQMLSQALNNGKWNMILLKNRKAALAPRHLAPFGFVLFLFIAFIGGIANKRVWKVEAGVVLLHITCGLYSALKKSRKVKDILIMPFLFLILHIAYGTGYLTGIFTKIKEE